MDNADALQPDPDDPPLRWGHPGFLIETLARAAALIWRWGRDPDVVSALLGRYSAHLGIVALALVIGVLGRLALSPEALKASHDAQRPFLPLAPAAAESVATATPNPGDSYLPVSASGPRAIVRHANPLTTIPERVRLEVVRYEVQEGDTIFGIAEAFKLSPYTIVWSNMEALQGAPWLLQPGLTLDIPPVDGAYHTVLAGESAASIAAAYEVDADALYNTWNDVEPGNALAEGTLLVIPGGIGADFDWDPPPPPTAVPVQAAAQPTPAPQSSGPAVAPPASGSFILPTGSYAVSGYVFGDWRNPRHQGLDYRCRLGDPIYAADSGTVIYAGWGGGYGNLVRVDHGNGFVTYYAHFNAFAVSSGQAVAQGQVVGYCGTTGASTGPHLHYEIRYGGVPQNPAHYEP